MTITIPHDLLDVPIEAGCGIEISELGRASMVRRSPFRSVETIPDDTKSDIEVVYQHAASVEEVTRSGELAVRAELSSPFASLAARYNQEKFAKRNVSAIDVSIAVRVVARVTMVRPLPLDPRPLLDPEVAELLQAFASATSEVERDRIRGDFRRVFGVGYLNKLSQGSVLSSSYSEHLSEKDEREAVHRSVKAALSYVFKGSASVSADNERTAHISKKLTTCRFDVKGADTIPQGRTWDEIVTYVNGTQSQKLIDQAFKYLANLEAEIVPYHAIPVLADLCGTPDRWTDGANAPCLAWPQEAPALEFVRVSKGWDRVAFATLPHLIPVAGPVNLTPKSVRLPMMLSDLVNDESARRRTWDHVGRFAEYDERYKRTARLQPAAPVLDEARLACELHEDDDDATDAIEFMSARSEESLDVSTLRNRHVESMARPVDFTFTFADVASADRFKKACLDGRMSCRTVATVGEIKHFALGYRKLTFGIIDGQLRLEGAVSRAESHLAWDLNARSGARALDLAANASSWVDVAPVWRGQRVSIRATGRVRCSKDLKVKLGPEGITPSSGALEKLAAGYGLHSAAILQALRKKVRNWCDDRCIVRGEPHAGLVARIGSQPPFFVGADWGGRVDDDGVLRILVNDTNRGNNTGAFSVTCSWRY